MLSLKELIKKNGDKLVFYKNCEKGKKYIDVFHYSQYYGGAYNSFAYYNDYVVEINNIG